MASRTVSALAAPAIVLMTATAAVAAPPLPTAKPNPTKSKQIDQCKALNACRTKYTHCANAIERDPKKSISLLDEQCVKPYRACINKHFGTFDMLFTRWFNPSYLKCE